ncbi:MAG: hypoxanthine phosphoribosyltransferase [Thermodesulfobacteriota bacterium]|nr:hypoxanthine phosphoribosyltransferase [Thermodesulfobacteriota bacterium]
MSEQLKEVISPERVRKRIRDMGREISGHYGGERVLAVCVLKGAYFFFADLVRSLSLDMELDFVRLASYGRGMSHGEIVFSKDVETTIQGRHVLLVEDIVDTGRSIDFLRRAFAERHPKSLKLAALVDKSERREVEVKVDFPGFTLEKGFLVGCGMDFAEKYRGLSGIYEIIEP